jgi:hypothetical protein
MIYVQMFVDCAHCLHLQPCDGCMMRLGILLIDNTDAVAIFHSEHVLLLSKDS